MVNLNLNLYKRLIRRGGVYWVTDLTNSGKKLYPCLVISNDLQNNISQFILALPIITKDLPTVPFHTQIIFENKPAKVIAEKLHLLDLSKLKLENYQGQIDQETMEEVEKSLFLVLNIKKS